MPICSWQSQTEERICAIVSESLEEYNRYGKAILGLGRDSPPFTRSYHRAAILKYQRMDGPCRGVSARHPMVVDLRWPSVSNSSGSSKGSSWASDILPVGVITRIRRRRKFGKYDHRHLGGGMAVTTGRHDVLVGTPVSGWHWGEGCISVGVQVHETENILAVFNKKRTQYQELGVYRILGRSGKQDRAQNNTKLAHWKESLPLLGRWWSRDHYQSGRVQKHITECCPEVGKHSGFSAPLKTVAGP